MLVPGRPVVSGFMVLLCSFRLRWFVGFTNHKPKPLSAQHQQRRVVLKLATAEIDQCLDDPLLQRVGV